MLTAQAEAEIRARHVQTETNGGPIPDTAWARCHADRAILLAHVHNLRETLKWVCEDAFSKEDCPAQCDSYGHAEECGATSAAVHARQLSTRLAQAEQAAKTLREAIVFLFTPGPGIAVPERHEQDWGDPAKITWNKKMDCLHAALAATAGVS